MAAELYHRYRPTEFDEVVGQDDAVRVLKKFVASKDVPHCLLFTGPSGVGKTTLARILRVKIGCSSEDCRELNTADFRGIDSVRDIRSQMGLAPMRGRCRVWIIDEAHQMSKDAQNAALKIFEDTPKHVYFMLATTEPQKLLKTIQSRCTEIKLVKVAASKMAELVARVAKEEEMALDEEVQERIVDVADGCARKALVLLGQVQDIGNTAEQLAAVAAGDFQNEGIAVARALFSEKTTWGEMAKVLASLADKVEAEDVRWIVMGYAKAILIKGKPSKRAFNMITAFERNFYDSKMNGLVAACYEVIHSK